MGGESCYQSGNHWLCNLQGLLREEYSDEVGRSFSHLEVPGQESRATSCLAPEVMSRTVIGSG